MEPTRSGEMTLAWMESEVLFVIRGEKRGREEMSNRKKVRWEKPSATNSRKSNN